MDELTAIGALAALAQPTRLTAFRTLVRAYPDPVAAGVVALALDVPHNTMSTHLAVLVRAGLAAAERRGRSVLYRADIGGFNALVAFLGRDCCDGRPELCSVLLPSTTASACCAPNIAMEVMP